MGKRKKEEDYAAELAKSFDRWEHLNTFGGQDPFWADGTNMNLVRNHIFHHKRRIEENMSEPYPEIYYRPTPPEVEESYMARKDEIRDNALKSLALYKSDENYSYLLNEMERLTDKQKKETSIENVIGYAKWLEHAISDDDYITMRRHESPKAYSESFARCADMVRNMPVDEKQLSFFGSRV